MHSRGRSQKVWRVQLELAGMAATDLQMPPPAAPRDVPVAMAATRVVMHQMVMPAEVDTLGICFGGQVQLPGQQCSLHSDSLAVTLGVWQLSVMEAISVLRSAVIAASRVSSYLS